MTATAEIVKGGETLADRVAACLVALCRDPVEGCERIRALPAEDKAKLAALTESDWKAWVPQLVGWPRAWRVAQAWRANETAIRAAMSV